MGRGAATRFRLGPTEGVTMAEASRKRAWAKAGRLPAGNSAAFFWSAKSWREPMAFESKSWHPERAASCTTRPHASLKLGKAKIRAER